MNTICKLLKVLLNVMFVVLDASMKHSKQTRRALHTPHKTHAPNRNQSNDNLLSEVQKYNVLEEFQYVCILVSQGISHPRKYSTLTPNSLAYLALPQYPILISENIPPCRTLQGYLQSHSNIIQAFWHPFLYYHKVHLMDTPSLVDTKVIFQGQ